MPDECGTPTCRATTPTGSLLTRRRRSKSSPVLSGQYAAGRRAGRLADARSGGQPRSGVDLGPDKIIKAGLPDQLKGLGYDVEYTGPQDFANIPYLPEPSAGVQRKEDPPIGNMKKPRLVSAVNERVAQSVAQAADKGWLPLTVGGDHSLVSVRSGEKSRSQAGADMHPRRWELWPGPKPNILTHA